jgi:hypothetical protein
MVEMGNFIQQLLSGKFTNAGGFNPWAQDTNPYTLEPQPDWSAPPPEVAPNNAQVPAPINEAPVTAAPTKRRLLTRATLQNPVTGKVTGYDSPDQALAAQAAQGPVMYSHAPGAELAIADQGTAATNPDGTPVTTSPNPGAPRFLQPQSFRDANIDPSTGMVRPPLTNPGLTKAGKLVSFLAQVAMGGLAGRAASEQAVVSSGGRRSGGFGMGFEAGVQQPYQQAALNQQVQRGGLQNQLVQAQVQNIPFLRAIMGQNLRKSQAQMDMWKAHADYWNSAAGKKDQDTLQQLHTNAVQNAVQQGRDPSQDPQVQQYADAITSIQRQPAERQETPFTVWRMQNPDADVSDYFRLGPEARAEFAPPRADRTPKPKYGTPGQFNAAGVRMRTRLQQLEDRFRWNPKDNLYHDMRSSHNLTPDEWDTAKQRVQDDYESEVANLGGQPTHVSYSDPVGATQKPQATAQAGNKPSRAQATTKAFNQDTGEYAYLINGKWYRENEVQ